MLSSRILCVGAAHWDLIARSESALRVGDDVPGRITSRPGGVAMNVALGLSAQGVKARLCSVIGDDDAGMSLIRHATAAGVDCGSVVRIKGANTNRYMAIENGEGELFAAVADTGLLEAHSSHVADEVTRALEEVDTLFVEANLPETEIERITSRAAACGVEIVANPVSPTKAQRLSALLSQKCAPTIIANLEEVNALLKSAVDNASDAAVAILANGAGSALITNGARRATLATQAGLVTSAPFELERDASVTGAGDALLAAFLAFPDRQGDPRAALAAALRAAAKHMETA
ncbi:MAG: PfkB family carbohydrate kinase [Pseudomonadota bacterium]